ncbi:VIT1/CCC1 family predicted Fe2+/Mn2+ transporter, partial [Actinomadura namibiensis]|nr:VIT1/CCC1 family predicted Fe2+/Mn2+ transporter [Actinomadura namibiensis]
GASMGSQLSSIIAGALAPIIAVELLKDYDSATPVSLYLCVAAIVTTITVAVARETRGRDLSAVLAERPRTAKAPSPEIA